MVNKTIIITGGNSGLGYETAKTLAQTGEYHIVIASRNLQRIEEAIDKLKAETMHHNFSAMQLDLASFASIRQFVNVYADTKLPALQAIICNAGLQQQAWNKTEDDVDVTFQVNHLGHFLFVNLMLQYLSRPSQIIFVSSGTHNPDNRLARMLGVPSPKYVKADYLAYPENAPVTKRLDNTFQAYSTSKLCNVLCAYELSRRLIDEGYSTAQAPIDVYAIDPGLMPGTSLVRDAPNWMANIFAGIVKSVEPLARGIRLPEQSAQDVARLVTDKSLRGCSPRYFDGHEEVSSSKASYDVAKQQDLWETSVVLTRLQSHETLLQLETSETVQAMTIGI